MSFDIIKSLTNEFTHESANTRKLLERIPLDNPSWKPHEKSMNIHDLAVHIADLSNFISLAIERDVMDFSIDKYVRKTVNNTEELLKIHEEGVAASLKAIAHADAEILKNGTFTMRNGEQVFFSLPKIATVRGMALNHLYHHRGQMTVYLRLLNIPVPGLYGPSADEH
ncbi:MAG: hypothetical protein RJA25_1759 [Bacteroidota bacterium]|jgi:uncharacterized damage-inducible protein DinB